MKRTICFAAFAFLFTNCVSYKPIPLKGTYPTPPISYTTTTPLDKVWDNIIDLFSQKGLSIKIIDRSSGLIISERTALSYSFENKDGALVKKEAEAVLEKIKENGSSFYYRPMAVTGEWNIRIKLVDGKTLVNVNLNNIMATYGAAYYSYSHMAYGPVVAAGKTTGKFEKMIYDIVK